MDNKLSNACLISGRVSPVSFSQQNDVAVQWKFINNILGRVRRQDESVQVATPSAQSDRSSETNAKDEWNRLKDQLNSLLIEDGGLSSIQSGEN